MGGKVSGHDLEALLQLFEESGWKEMELRYGDTQLFLSKDPQSHHTRVTAASGAQAAVAPAPVASAVASAAPAGGGAAAEVQERPVPPGWLVVRAPSLGNFYRAPKPGAPPFAELGMKVDAESELCLVEVMKLFTTVRSGVSGWVREIYAQDSQLVEFDQPLFLIEPDA